MNGQRFRWLNDGALVAHEKVVNERAHAKGNKRGWAKASNEWMAVRDEIRRRGIRPPLNTESMEIDQ